MWFVRAISLLLTFLGMPVLGAEGWALTYGGPGGAGTAIMAERDGTLWVAGTQPGANYAKQIWFARTGWDGKVLLERSITKSGVYGSVEIAPAQGQGMGNLLQAVMKPGSFSPRIVSNSSSIQSMCWAFVMTSGAGTSCTGPMEPSASSPYWTVWRAPATGWAGGQPPQPELRAAGRIARACPGD